MRLEMDIDEIKEAIQTDLSYEEAKGLSDWLLSELKSFEGREKEDESEDFETLFETLLETKDLDECEKCGFPCFETNSCLRCGYPVKRRAGANGGGGSGVK